MACAVKELSVLSGVSGKEDQVRRYIKHKLEGICDSISVNSMGSITAFKRGRSSAKTVMICTGIDEPGFIVSGITDKGYIKFKAVGRPDIRTVISKRVLINCRISGVIGMKAIHLQKKSEREAAPEISSLYIDIGCKSKAEAEKLVKLGDYVSFDSGFYDNGSVYMGKAFSRIGVTALLEAVQCTPAYDTYFVFAAQCCVPDAIPGRGLKTAAAAIKANYALIIDTVSADDVYSEKKRPRICSLGSGAAIEYMDKTCIHDVLFTDSVSAAAERCGINIQKITAPAEQSIAGAVSSASVVTAAAAIPCRYMNAPMNMANKKDMDALAQLCRLFIQESDVIIDGIAQKTD